MFGFLDKFNDELPLNGRTVITTENGMVKSVRVIRDDEHVATLMAFVDMALIAGYLLSADAIQL